MPCYKGDFVAELILSVVAVVVVFFRTRSDTALEILAPRQQVAVLKRMLARRAFNSLDQFFGRLAAVWG